MSFRKMIGVDGNLNPISISHQYLTNVLTDSKCDSRPNHTSNGKVYFTDFFQNFISLNMGIHFLPRTSWRLLEAKNTPQRPKKA